MPQPSHLSSASCRSGGMLERKECAALLAAITTEWTYIEDRLVDVLASVLGGHAVSDDWSVGLNYSRFANISIQSLRDIRARVKMVDDVLAELIRDEEVIKSWKILHSECCSCAEQRNEVVHCKWYYADERPDALLMRDERTGKFLEWREADFRVILDRLIACREQAWMFVQALLEGQRAAGTAPHQC